MKQNVFLQAAIAGFLMFITTRAELPPDLPGEEISHEALNAAVPRDTIPKTAVPKAANGTTGLPWLDKAQKTWDAPPLAEQMAADAAVVPIGKGGIFVPRFTAATREPDVNILDSLERTVASGNAGRTFSVAPGTYRVVLGSGTHQQRLTRSITVEEGKTVPVVPDWAGLAIETVDSMTTPFRGEYELVRLDEFEAYGRGLGAKPELGEEVKAWILNPGVYKILGIGQGYNSLLNFVTVRLVPGELCKFLLVQDTISYRILGGGTIDVTPQSKITSHWKYGINIGGNINFNAEVDRALKDTTSSTLFGLLSTLWLNYQRHPYEWQTRIRLNEGFNFSGLSFSNLLTDADDFLLNTLYIWRFFSWIGPYGSAELRTTFLPRSFNLSANNSYFCLLDENKYISPSVSFDSSRTFRLKPSFAPLLFTVGIGVNADALKYSFLETNVRAGFAGNYSHFPRQYQVVDSSTIKWSTLPPDTGAQRKLGRSVVILPVAETSDYGFGPQVSLSGIVRLGSLITADGEFKVFAPITPHQRLLRPDFDFFSNFSLRLTHLITLDYTYAFLLIRPERTNAQVDKSTHGVWLRFSYSNR
jgi:hypothetical protein